MAEEDEDSKTEQPTSRRLGKAREEGNVLQSTEVKTLAMLVAMLVVVWLGLPFTVNHLKLFLSGILAHLGEVDDSTPQAMVLLGDDIVLHMVIALAVPLSIMLAFALLVSLGQTGLLFLPQKLLPDFSKINPLAGLKRIFSINAVLDLVKSVLKMAIVGTGSYFLLQPHLHELELLMTMDLSTMVLYLHHILVKLVVAVVMMMMVIAAADWFYQRFTYMKKLRMSRQELKDEHKDSEGDPMIKARLRSLRIARARRRMMAAVPKADVIVTNPTHYACALKYDMDSMGAPVLLAKGIDAVAFRIRDLAEEHEIPIVENPPLARALYASVDLDQEIPPEHYKAVAEVISYVMRLKEKHRGPFNRR
ncbi:flagellar biosynthetic protein FlhB [mine drainage metagenome]|uniref:Flagellar biosynthetic protein FlhB n=1 Tax=mine drainage metagenome TaxID=410659 RepID=A0A1J5S0H4_9ZZZZ